MRAQIIYHFGLLLLEGTETLPPPNNPTLGLHQVTADLVETLLLLSGPVDKEDRQDMGVIKNKLYPGRRVLFS